jgi:hypothetical protein
MEISPIIQLLFWFGLLIVSCYYFIVLIAHPFKRRKYITGRAEKTSATIIDYKIDTDLDGVKYYYPVLEFSDKTGKRIIVDAEIGKNYKYEAGKQLEIYYLPQDPYQFYIINSIPGEMYLLPFGLIAIGLIVYAIFKTISIL